MGKELRLIIKLQGLSGLTPTGENGATKRNDTC
jgi:hypothetical protein